MFSKKFTCKKQDHQSEHAYPSLNLRKHVRQGQKDIFHSNIKVINLTILFSKTLKFFGMLYLDIFNSKTLKNSNCPPKKNLNLLDINILQGDLSLATSCLQE
jgi:hypothetical protein